MKLNDVIEPSRVLTRCKLGSKKAVITKVSETLGLALPDLDEDVIAEKFFNRERLGSTGVGYGVAIPHVRDESLTQACACFLQLSSPVDYDAPDHHPVDLIFALMVPAHNPSSHLQLLAEIAKRFSDPDFREEARRLTDPDALHEFMTQHAYQYACA